MFSIVSMRPELRINNRRINQEFLEQTLGMKTLHEENAYVQLGDTSSKTAKLLLEEAPSMRTRAVEGLKKLERIVIRVADAREIEALLAKGSAFTRLYRGKNGLAFEAISPEKDVFLLHAEEDRADLEEIASADFQALDGFEKLTAFEVESVVIRTPDKAASQAFYAKYLPACSQVQFVEAQGPDLLANAESVWDLEALHFTVAEDTNFDAVAAELTEPYFKDKKKRFLQTTDPSHIEWWFEK